MKMNTMRYSLIFLTAIIFFFSCKMTQKTPTDFEAKWKQVDTLIKKDGLTRSAIEKIRVIQDLAKKENQVAHEIKAIVYPLSVIRGNCRRWK
jgi:hypothetical protein